MGSLEYNDFSTQADEVMTPNNAKVEMVNVGGQNVMQISAKPGWNGLQTPNLWSAQKAAKQNKSALLSNVQLHAGMMMGQK